VRLPLIEQAGSPQELSPPPQLPAFGHPARKTPWIAVPVENIFT
jgi:hypothetical protein